MEMKLAPLSSVQQNLSNDMLIGNFWVNCKISEICTLTVLNELHLTNGKS